MGPYRGAPEEPSWTGCSQTMPITLSIRHLAYARLLAQGGLGDLLAMLRCPRCNRCFKLTGRRLRRPLVVMRDGRCYLLEDFVVAQAACVRCGYSQRLLPADVLAGKRYSIDVYEAAALAYLERPGGLRQAVRSLGFYAPDFTTLHGWLGGLGGYATGLTTPQGAVPAEALLEETRRRVLPDLNERWRQSAPVDPRRHRSERRREELEGVVRLLRIATAVALANGGPPTAGALTSWIVLTIGWFGVAAISWSARRAGTWIQPRAKRRAIGFGPRKPKPEDTPCRTRSRSPPSDSR